MKKIELPEWLENELPAPKPVLRISYKNDVFVLIPNSDLDSEQQKLVSRFTDKTYPTIVEAYDDVNSKTVDVTFDSNVNSHGGKLRSSSFWCEPEKGERSARLLIGMTDKTRKSILKSDYSSFLEDHAEYEKDPTDWVLAYNWLTKHPAFWYKHKEEKSLDWSTDNGLKDVYVYVTRTKKGKARVYMEHGSHVEPQYMRFYHDPRLDVVASSMEKAYVKLAKKVNKFFHPDGTEKENVKYKKNKLEKKLDSLAAQEN